MVPLPSHGMCKCSEALQNPAVALSQCLIQKVPDGHQLLCKDKMAESPALKLADRGKVWDDAVRKLQNVNWWMWAGVRNLFVTLTFEQLLTFVKYFRTLR